MKDGIAITAVALLGASFLFVVGRFVMWIGGYVLQLFGATHVEHFHPAVHLASGGIGILGFGSLFVSAVVLVAMVCVFLRSEKDA